MRTQTQQGFTLVELVITIVISTIVVSFVSLFISGPVMGFADQTRRARLVDAADAALRRIGRDVRRALPNSVRAVVLVFSAAAITTRVVLPDGVIEITRSKEGSGPPADHEQYERSPVVTVTSYAMF